MAEQDDLALRTVLEAAPLVLWAVDRDGIFTLRTGKALQLIGDTPGDLVGESIFLSHPREIDFHAAVRRALAGESASCEVTYKGIDFRAEMQPQHDPEGNVKGVIGVSYDVTERRRAERALEEERRALRRSEARLAEAQRIAHVGSWEFDAVANERWWSAEMYRICGLGLDAGAPTEAMVRNAYHPEDLQKRDRALEYMLATGEPSAIDVRIVTPDGITRCCRLVAKVDTAPDGRLLRIAGVAADITDRVESEEQFRTLFEISSDPLLTVDLQEGMRILDCNMAAADIFGGGDKSKVVGRRPEDISPELQPDGVPSKRVTPELHAAMAAGRSYRFEWTHRAFDGSDATFDVVLSPLTATGKPIAIALYRDLTQRRRTEMALRESEQRLRLALESGALGAWDLDLKAKIFHDVSGTMKTFFAADAEVDMTWAALQTSIHNEDLPRVLRTLNESLENRTAAGAEFRAVVANGASRWFLANGVPMEDGPTPHRIIGVIQDITERKEREFRQKDELAAAHERAERDPVTGLLNHRAFHKALDAYLQNPAGSDGWGALVLFDLDSFKFFNDVYGHTVGDEVLRTVADTLRARRQSGDILARFGGDEFALLRMGVGPRPPIAHVEQSVRAILAGMVYQPEGQLSPIPITASAGTVLIDATVPADRARLVATADERLRLAKSGGNDESEARRMRAAANTQVEGYSMLDALVVAVDNKDRYTRRHSEDVMDYSLMIARALGMSLEEQEVIAQAALLHDVGKIGIPDTILRKPGELTDVEFAAIKQHPRMGAVIVSAVPGLEATLDAIRYHHEAWNGEGYPHGLKGEETPRIARLMAVADAFSAMTTSRPYRLAMDRSAAIAILEAGAGVQWDPCCVAALVGALRREEPAVDSGNNPKV